MHYPPRRDERDEAGVVREGRMDGSSVFAEMRMGWVSRERRQNYRRGDDAEMVWERREGWLATHQAA